MFGPIGPEFVMHMQAFESPEDLLADESFLAWYYQTDPGVVGQWEEWLRQDLSHKELVDKAVELLDELDLPEVAVPEAQIDAAEARLFERINLSASVVPIRRRGPWMAVAAAILLLGVAAWTLRAWINRKETLSTPYGQIAKTVLPDGTEVTLNAHSSLVYGHHWTEGSDREVWIKGEAFLHVAKKPLHDRFIVHTDHFDVIVTGTSFNVVNEGDLASVVLKEGHVTVRQNNCASGQCQEIKMEPGDQVRLEGTALVKQNVNPEGVIAWTDQKIEFDSATMADVARMIEQHYGVNVSIERSALLSYPVNGMLPNNNLNDLLKALSALYYKDLNIQREGDRIIIR